MKVLEENDILFAHKALNIMSGLTDATRRVAGAIIDHFNRRTGQCDPSIERLSTLLDIDRATVIRATEKLNALGLIVKTSHGGKAHRASYLPNWEHFHFIVAEWAARMKTGDSPSARSASDASALRKVASVRRSQSQRCDVEGRTDATQTNRSNQPKKPIEPERAAKPRQEPPAKRLSEPSLGLWRGSEPMRRRTIIPPPMSGNSPSHADAARAAAERRWYADLRSHGPDAMARVIEWMDLDRQERATTAELERRGGGMAFIAARMSNERMHAHG